MFVGRSDDPEGDHLCSRSTEHKSHRCGVPPFYYFIIFLFQCDQCLDQEQEAHTKFYLILLFKPDGCVLRPSSSAAYARYLRQRDIDEQRDSETWKTSSFLNPSSDSFRLLSILHSCSRPVSFSDDAGSLFKVKRPLRHVQEFAIKSELFKLCSETWIPQICRDLLSFLAPFHSHLHFSIKHF